MKGLSVYEVEVIAFGLNSHFSAVFKPRPYFYIFGCGPKDYIAAIATKKEIKKVTRSQITKV